MGLGGNIAASVATAGVSIYQGQRTAHLQAQVMADQRRTQEEARIAAQRQQRMNEMAIRKANAAAPDLGSLLGDEQLMAQRGTGGTLLTKPGVGVQAADLTLGKTSLLGD